MTNDDAGLEPDFDPPLDRACTFDARGGQAWLRPGEDGSASAPGRSFEGPAEFAGALRAMLDHAAARGARRLQWCDPDFAAWPLGEVGWIDTLTRWARSGPRELVMVAASYETVFRRHPRFVAWRREFAHVVQCLAPDESHAAALPTLWIDATQQALRVFDAERVRGRSGFDRLDRQGARDLFDAIAQRATPAFAAATLGL